MFGLLLSGLLMRIRIRNIFITMSVLHMQRILFGVKCKQLKIKIKPRNAFFTHTGRGEGGENCRRPSEVFMEASSRGGKTLFWCKIFVLMDLGLEGLSKRVCCIFRVWGIGHNLSSGPKIPGSVYCRSSSVGRLHQHNQGLDMPALTISFIY